MKTLARMAGGLLLAFLAGFVPEAATPTGAELAQALQRRYDGIRDFSADFVHTYRGGVLRTPLTEKGRVLVKKPGKMRWEYTSPETKVFVSDGVKMYSYVPQDRQVIVANVPSDDTASAPALFLAGKGNLVRDYSASIETSPDGAQSGTIALKLVPRTPQPDYDWLMLVVDAKTLAIQGLIAADSQGGTSSFSFSNLRENIGLPEKTFVFQMPRGVDVVTDSGER